jgi:hypothetical protein
VEQIGANDVTQANDPVIFQYKELSQATTAVSHHGSVNVLVELIWIGKDNVYATDGTNVRALANRISHSIKTFDLTSDIDKISAFNDASNKRVIFLIKSNASQSEPNYALVGSYLAYPEFFWTIYTQYTFGCIFPVPSTNLVYAGNASLNGKVYSLGIGTNDNGSAIPFSATTPPISFGIDEEEKLYTMDLITTIGNGTNYSLTAKSLYNLQNVASETGLLNLNAAVSLWGSFLWGTGLWATDIPGQSKHFSHRKAYYKQLYLEQLDADAPITIWGYTMMAAPQGFR